jgi:hypothetical protein
MNGKKLKDRTVRIGELPTTKVLGFLLQRRATQRH